MEPSDSPGEDRIRAIVRDELVGAGWSLIGTVFWSILSLFAILVGLQLLQLVFYTSSELAAIGFLMSGALIIAASLYLLYVLHWR
jgi:hypothetical protein